MSDECATQPSTAHRGAWIQNLQQLGSAVEGKQSSVILTHPARSTDAVSLGKALRWTLAGKTHNFNAAVGGGKNLKFLD